MSVGRRDHRARRRSARPPCRPVAFARALPCPPSSGTAHRAGLVDRDHRRVGVLAVEQRGDQADRRARREEAHERVALLPGAGHRGRGRPVVAASRRPRGAEPAGGGTAGGRDRDQPDHSAHPPRPAGDRVVVWPGDQPVCAARQRGEPGAACTSTPSGGCSPRGSGYRRRPVRSARRRRAPRRFAPARRAAHASTTAGPPPPTNTASGSGSPVQRGGRLAVDGPHRHLRACAALAADAGYLVGVAFHRDDGRPEPGALDRDRPAARARRPRRAVQAGVPSRDSATARTSALVTMPARCSNASSGSAQPASGVARPARPHHPIP